MKLPAVENPERYRGLYVFDFGEWTAVGYTADEIETLLQSEKYRGGAVYRIHRAYPDGRMELRGVAPERFHFESGMFFRRAELADARRDFDALLAAAERQPPPSRAYVHLAECRDPGAAGRFLTALVYPAESDEDVAEWLLGVGFWGGDQVEGGVSHVTNYYDDLVRVIERRQLWSAATHSVRSAEEVLASVRRAVQR